MLTYVVMKRKPSYKSRNINELAVILIRRFQNSSKWVQPFKQEEVTNMRKFLTLASLYNFREKVLKKLTSQSEYLFKRYPTGESRRNFRQLLIFLIFVLLLHFLLFLFFNLFFVFIFSLFFFLILQLFLRF